MKVILPIVFAIVLGSCQPLAKMVYGCKEPAVQTAEGIASWLNREGLQPQNLASVSPESFFDVFMRYNTGLLVFSSDGRLLPIGYKNGRFCPQDITEVLATLKPMPGSMEAAAVYSSVFADSASDALQPTRSSLQFLFARLRTLQGGPIRLNPEPVDYIILIPFALSLGSRLQTKDMRTYVRALSRNPHARFSIWFLNFDKQAWWGEEWNGKIVIQ